MVAFAAEDLPAGFVAGELAGGAFAVQGCVQGEVGGEGLGEAVDVVVGDEADDVVGDYFAPGPGFGGAEVFHHVDGGVVEHLRGVGFGDARKAFFEGEIVAEGEVG